MVQLPTMQPCHSVPGIGPCNTPVQRPISAVVKVEHMAEAHFSPCDHHPASPFASAAEWDRAVLYNRLTPIVEVNPLADLQEKCLSQVASSVMCRKCIEATQAIFLCRDSIEHHQRPLARQVNHQTL